MLMVVFSFNSAYADTLDSIVMSANNGGTTFDFKSGVSYQSYIGFSYRPGASHNVCSVTVKAAAIGSPTDALTLDVSYGSTQSTNVWGHLFALTDVNWTTGTKGAGTFKRSADAGFQIRSTSFSDYTYTFTPCLTVVGGTYYNFVWHRTPNEAIRDENNTYKFYGDYSNLAATTHVGTGEFHFDYQWSNFTYRSACLSTTNCPDRVPAIGFNVSINGTENFGAVAEDKPGLSITSLLSSFTDGNASSSLTTEVGSFAKLGDYVITRAPFGYLPQIYQIYATAATSSTQFSAISLDFTATSISTSTRSYLPGNLVVLSTSTVASYFGTNNLSTFNTLVSATLYVSLLYYIFRRTSGLIPA